MERQNKVAGRYANIAGIANKSYFVIFYQATQHAYLRLIRAIVYDHRVRKLPLCFGESFRKSAIGTVSDNNGTGIFFGRRMRRHELPILLILITGDPIIFSAAT